MEMVVAEYRGLERGIDLEFKKYKMVLSWKLKKKRRMLKKDVSKDSKKK